MGWTRGYWDVVSLVLIFMNSVSLKQAFETDRDDVVKNKHFGRYKSENGRSY